MISVLYKDILIYLFMHLDSFCLTNLDFSFLDLLDKGKQLVLVDFMG